jgi:hypothetical protein
VSAAYDSGFSDGYAEGYACKLTDATEPFKLQSLDVPEMVDAVAEMLVSKFRATFPDKPSAIGCARLMIAILKADACDNCGGTPIVTELDGDRLCQSCADSWCRAEGASNHDPY